MEHATPTPEAAGLREVLQRESARIVSCRRIVSSLEKLVHFDYDQWRRPEPPLRARPKLTLSVARAYESRSNMIDRTLPPALEALSVVLNHSLRLNAFPTLKTEFWRGLMGVNMWDTSDLREGMGEWPQLFQDKSFPDLRIDMNRKGVMTIKHLDAFFEFLTTPAAHGVDAKYAQEYEALT